MPDQTTAKKPARSNWILWWRIDPAQLDRQVTEYDVLGVFRSMRGISMLLLFFSMATTLVLVQMGAFGIDRYGFIDVGLMGVLSLFINLGHRWAMIGAMVLWTLEKTLVVFVGLGPAHRGAPLVVGQPIWWCIYMHAFYFALRIEQQRRARVDPTVFE